MPCVGLGRSRSYKRYTRVPCVGLGRSWSDNPCACSFVEESNADKAIKALTAALAPRARVKRDGKVKSVEASELVPGDIIIIQFGNIVPADVKLLGHAGADEAPMQVPAQAALGNCDLHCVLRLVCMPLCDCSFSSVQELFCEPVVV